jgi:hypothetical protein
MLSKPREKATLNPGTFPKAFQTFQGHWHSIMFAGFDAT